MQLCRLVLVEERCLVRKSESKSSVNLIKSSLASSTSTISTFCIRNVDVIRLHSSFYLNTRVWTIILIVNIGRSVTNTKKRNVLPRDA